ncbi:MAG: zinc ribbon domain-containing protein [Acidobacteria bacterium]|nr:zinc ribbon domain-containing protein [Acidobacteriota bacterium]
MFCPKCATQNIEGARFCRSCGADISLVPQAMTGQMQVASQLQSPDEDDDWRRRRHRRGPSIERGIKHSFMGLGFIFVALALAFSHNGRGWWFWMLVPAFSMLGGGVAEYLRARNAGKELPLQRAQAAAIPQPRSTYMNELPPRGTSELMAPPPSVTEGTTRHLGAEGPTKVFSPAEHPKQEG